MIARLLILIAVLNTLDVITTLWLVNQGYQEANPIMRGFMASGVFVQVKMLATALFIAFAYISSKYLEEKISRIVRIACSAALTIPATILLLAVVNNTAVSFFGYTPFEVLICRMYGCATP